MMWENAAVEKNNIFTCSHDVVFLNHECLKFYTFVHYIKLFHSSINFKA